MSTLPLFDATGAPAGEMTVPATLFGAAPNEVALHQVVQAELAARRQGTQATKTRGDVSGSTRKLWRQKGTGRARVGDRRPPHWRGGGVAMGPHPRSYRQRVSKQLKRESLRWALSAQANGGGVVLVEPFELAEAKTRALASLLEATGARGQALLVLAERSEAIWRCGRNLPGLVVAQASEVQACDVLSARRVVISTDALPRLEARLA